MRKNYSSGLIGLDIKNHPNRRIRPNRYKLPVFRRWMIPFLLALLLIVLAVLVRVSS